MENLPENLRNADSLVSNKYFALTRGRKVGQIQQNEFLKILRDKIKLTYFEAGQDKNLDRETLDMTTTIFARDVLDKFKYITIDELSEALHLGVRKRFGDYYGLSVVTLLSWVESFITMPDRFEALKKAHALNEKIALERRMKEVDQKQQMLMIIPNMVSQFKKLGRITDFGNVRYDYLVSKGEIQEDDYKRFIQEAERKIYDSLEQERQDAFVRMDRFKSSQITKELDSLVDGENQSVVRLAKNLSVQNFVVNFIKVNNL